MLRPNSGAGFYMQDPSPVERRDLRGPLRLHGERTDGLCRRCSGDRRHGRRVPPGRGDLGQPDDHRARVAVDLGRVVGERAARADRDRYRRPGSAGDGDRGRRYRRRRDERLVRPGAGRNRLLRVARGMRVRSTTRSPSVRRTRSARSRWSATTGRRGDSHDAGRRRHPRDDFNPERIILDDTLLADSRRERRRRLHDAGRRRARLRLRQLQAQRHERAHAVDGGLGRR